MEVLSDCGTGVNWPGEGEVVATMCRRLTKFLRNDHTWCSDEEEGVLTARPEARGLEEVATMPFLDLSFQGIQVVPAWVYAHSNLYMLDLSHNPLGVCPFAPGFGDDTNRQLLVLILDHCHLTQIPKEVFLLRCLRRLRFENNFIPSVMKCSFKRLSLLTSLSLVRNTLRKLPNSFQDLVKLRVLDLSHNQFHAFPKILLIMEHLEVLKMSGNYLKDVPKVLSTMNGLRHLELAHNVLSATPNRLPDELELLDLYNNFLEEKGLAESIGQLVMLDLDQNQFDPSSWKIGYLDAQTRLRTRLGELRRRSGFPMESLSNDIPRAQSTEDHSGGPASSENINDPLNYSTSPERGLLVDIEELDETSIRDEQPSEEAHGTNQGLSEISTLSLHDEWVDTIEVDLSQRSKLLNPGSLPRKMNPNVPRALLDPWGVPIPVPEEDKYADGDSSPSHPYPVPRVSSFDEWGDPKDTILGRCLPALFHSPLVRRRFKSVYDRTYSAVRFQDAD